MKINFIVPSTSTAMGGGIRVIFRHANYLACHGHDVMIYVPMLYFIGKRFILKTTIANSITRRARLDWMEHRFKTKTAFRIQDACIRDADITIATAWYTASAVNKLSKRKGAKVYFIQGYEIWNQDENEVNATYLMDMHRIVITNKLHDLLKSKFGVDSSVVYNGHDAQEYLHETKTLNNPRTIMMLWGSAYFKGCDPALKLLYKLHDKYGFNVTLFSVEPQPKGLPEYVSFYHRPERRQLIELYQEADIYLFSSIDESWGLPVMEAMANKCAVVGMNTGILKDVCEDGKQALIAENGNYQELQEKLEKLLNDVTLMQRIQENGYQFSLNFSWEHQSAMFEKELLEVCNNNGQDHKRAMTTRKKIIRACTASLSIGFVEGLLPQLKEKYEVVLLSSPGEDLDEAVARHHVKGIAVPMERHISVTKDIKALIKLIGVLLRERPQMVHSMTPKAGLLCMMAAWLTRVPVRVHTFTGLVWPTEKGLKRRILMATDWLTCACATHIIPEGEGVKNDLLNDGITKKPLRVLGYGNVRGIDLEKFSRRKEVLEKVTQISQISQIKKTSQTPQIPQITQISQIAKGSQMFTFLFVGRIVGDKGINEMVNAFKRLNEVHKDTQLILVGWFEQQLDPVSEKTRETIEQHPCIHAVGTKEGDELLAYYAAADCFVFPSYREGFPNTVIEAGAMELPCIVTDINGSREIIIQGENGIIIPPRNEEALYNAMLRMMTDNEERQRMASNARQMIAERYEQGYVRQCLLDYYEQILKD